MDQTPEVEKEVKTVDGDFINFLRDESELDNVPEFSATLATGNPPKRLDNHKKLLYLKAYARLGLKNVAAKAAGIGRHSINRHLKEDPVFAEAFQVAHELFCERLEAEAIRRSVIGVTEPIIGGKDRDQVITTVQRYSDRLHELLLKRHIPEFRDKSTVDVNVKAGVMVVPGASVTAEQWAQEHGGTKALPGETE